MPRAAVLVILVLAMLWQSVAMARIGSSVNVLADPQHAAMHWHAQDHHHHDDGTYHPDHATASDDAPEATRHLLCDHVSATTALLTAHAAGFPAAGSVCPVVAPQARWPEQPLDGLLRPPRLHP